MASTDSFPRRRAATRGFRLGAPRTVSITPTGDAVLFLRSDGPTDPVNHLWRATWDSNGFTEEKIVDASSLTSGSPEELPPEERARRERLREVSGGITAYSTDDEFTAVCFTLSGELYCHSLTAGTTRQLGTQTGLGNPVLDPTGRRIAATHGRSLLLYDTGDGSHAVLREPDTATQTWGSAEFIAAEEMGRYSGLWWAPDGERLLVQRSDDAAVATWYIADPANPSVEPTAQRYPAAGTANSEVRLFVLGVDGSETEVDWDRNDWEYLARVQWNRHGLPIITVQNRSQAAVQILEVDPDTGRSTLLAEESSPQWVELVAGSPRRTAAGLLHTMIDPDGDARRLVLQTVDGPVLTPPEVHVTAVTSDDDTGAIFVGHSGDPATQDVWRLDFTGGIERISEPGGWSTGLQRGGTSVISTATEHDVASAMTVHPTDRDGGHVIGSQAETPGVSPKPTYLADNGWSRIAVLLPADPPPGQLPIIMSPYGGPHGGRSLKAGSAFLTEQWLADQGYCVVVADGPGSPSRPTNEYAIHRDLAAGPLAGQVSALDQVVAHYPDLVDPTRVGIRGWSFGGYLSALAVLERPDKFHAAVAGAPVTTWELYDTHYTERYLGTPQTHPEAYSASDLIGRAHLLQRPLLLVHGLADDNVVAAHTLRLSSALLAAGRPHSVLPLSGVTHMTPQEVVAENLMRAELDFFAKHLAPGT